MKSSTVSLSVIIAGLIYILLFCVPSQSDVDAAWQEGYAAGHNDASEELSLKRKPDIDNVLEQAAVFATDGTTFGFYEVWNDVMEYLDKNGPDYSGLNAWEKAVKEYDGKTKVPNSILKKVRMLVYYCMYLDDYDTHYEPDFTDMFE